MGFNRRFLPYSVQLATAGDVAAWINQIESTTPNAGISLFEETSGSEIDREFVADKEVKPILDIVTSDLTILTTVGYSGIPISSGDAAPGAVVYGRLIPNNSVPSAIGNSDHMTLSISDGVLVPESVRASHNSVAKLNFKLYAEKGTDDTSGATPFVYALLQTIPSGAGATANIYTAGPIHYNSTLEQGISDLNFTFGLGVTQEGSDGDVYPSHTGIFSRMSKIEFTTKDAELISAIGDGLAVTSFAAYFRKVASSGLRVPIATTSHLKIAGTAGMITPGALTLKYKTAGTSSFTYTPVKNTNQLAISFAAIPAS